MSEFKIKVECFLGMSHCGGVTAYDEGMVELSDNDISTLVSLVREKKTDDIKELELEEKYPDIYEKLYDAYWEIAGDAVSDHWYMDAYYCGDIEYDTEELMDYCRCHYGFATKYDQMDEDELEELGLDEDEIAEAIVDEFDEWFRPFLKNLNHEERRKLFDGPLYFELEEYDMDLGEYEIKIPAEIVELAKEG